MRSNAINVDSLNLIIFQPDDVVVPLGPHRVENEDRVCHIIIPTSRLKGASGGPDSVLNSPKSGKSYPGYSSLEAAEHQAEVMTERTGERHTILTTLKRCSPITRKQTISEWEDYK